MLVHFLYYITLSLKKPKLKHFWKFVLGQLKTKEKRQKKQLDR